MKPKIAIQGIESSFHHLAVNTLLDAETLSLLQCDSFEKVINAVVSFKSDYALMAIENTIAGAILPNYNLIADNDLVILDEVYLHIQMHLMALHGQSIHDIKEVHSHPVALQQCKDYLSRFPPQFKVIEGKDTASEAKKIKENRLDGVAAIAGKQVAAAFGLEILDSNIQSMKNNKTRFVLLGRKAAPINKTNNKASLRFQLHHDVGSLSGVLQLFDRHKINLTKIQSLPVIGAPWEYAFFIELLFEDYALFSALITLLEESLKDFKLMGVYRENKDNKKSNILSDLKFNSAELKQ